MPFTLAVPYRSVVPPFSVAVLHRSSFLLHRSSIAPMHRRRAVPARMSTTSCVSRAHHSLHVGHLCGAFSTLRASPISAGVCPLMTWLFAMSSNVIIFMVNLHPLPSGTPTKMLSMWGNVGRPRTLTRNLRVDSVALMPYHRRR